MQEKPILGITMGDPSGIGPEITIKTLMKKHIYDICRPVVVGDALVMRKACEMLGHPELKVIPVSSIKECRFEYGAIEVYDLQNVDVAKLKIGQVDAMSGAAAFTSVQKVIELALAGEIDATITNPLNKEALNLAGYHYSGHTEIYADLTHTKDYSMMLAEGELRVVHVSTHVSLRQACDLVKKERVLKVIHLADDACKGLGITNPRIAVAGLNPHSGENGMFGTEEIEEITPAIEAAQAEGIDVCGPVPPDTLFSKALGGMYDIVVAMYHDQGHIPVKVIGFKYVSTQKHKNKIEGINVTLGLPIIRASVDHGTAFDIAGKSIADETSLVTAIEYAQKIAINQK